MAKADRMADEIVKYARKHKKLMGSFILFVFVTGGVFYTARADIESNKTKLEKLEPIVIGDHAKLDAIAEDVKAIKTHLMGAN